MSRPIERLLVCDCGLRTLASDWQKEGWGAYCPCPQRRFASFRKSWHDKAPDENIQAANDLSENREPGFAKRRSGNK